MDFQSLSRRELQALCKKNKIPANATNVAMADSLKSLEIVEGIDEVFQTCESGIAQLSIEPRVRLEATSPFPPSTGGRSTRRTNAAKEETSRRSTQTTMAKYANESQVDAFETPVAPQTNRKKGQTSSACRKMDSLLKECAQEEKKDALLTPAPLGVTSQRRRAAKEESAVKQVQGTRRSARLAEKSAKLLKQQGNENPVFFNKDLFTNDCLELKMNLKEIPDGLDEISGVTDVGAGTNLEENSAKKDEEQVDSSEKQDIATDVEPVPTIDGAKPELNESSDHNLDLTVVDAITIVEENPEKQIQSEVVPCEKQVVSTVEEVELVPSNEGEMSDSETDGAKVELKEIGSKIAAELDNQNCAEAFKDADIVMALNLNNEAQETDGCDVIETSMTNIGVEKTEESTDEDPGPEDEAVIECEDDFSFSESDNDIFNDKDSDPEEVAPFGMNEEVLELNTDMHEEDSSETESNSDESDPDVSEPTDESTKSNDPLAGMPSDLNLMSDEDDAVNLDVILEVEEKILVKDKQLEFEQSAKQVSSGTVLEDVRADEPEQTEIVQHEENVKTVDQVLLGASNYLSDAPSSEEAVDGLNLQNSPTQQLAGVGDGVLSGIASECITPSFVENEAVPLNFAEPDASLIIPPASTPVKASASKASAIKKRIIVAASDNKENIDSGSKTTRTKERSKVVKEIAETVLKLDDDQTMRQLSNKIKKLEITKKLDKNEGENEVSARPALQVLPENQ